MARAVVGTGIVVALVASGIVAAGDRAPESDGWSYVAADGEMAWIAIQAPVPAEQIGRSAAQIAVGEQVAPVLGDPIAAPRGFPAGKLAGAARGKGPFGGRAASGKCDCGTEIGDESAQRTAVLYTTTTFRVGDEVGDLDVLVLEVRYWDGMVAYINGREVARRSVDPADPINAPARRVRGPEVERFYIPVVDGLLRRGENRLSFEVKPSADRLSPRLAASLTGRRGARVVRGPIVQRVGADRATIVFDTDVPARGTVEWGSSASLGKRAASASGSLAVHHEIELTSLPRSAAVHYRVAAGGAPTPVHSFHTAPAAGEMIRFAVYGDMRGGHRTHQRIVDALLAEGPDFTIVTGDLVLRGTDEGDWQRLFAVAGELFARIACYTVAGNHDLGRAGDELRRIDEIFAAWPGPTDRPASGHWYSFDVADLHFVMLDSNAYEDPAQLAWLERDLAAAWRGGVRAVFAVTHDGPYSRGIHLGNTYAAEHYVPVLARHRVTLLFSGHDHLYQRGRAEGLAYMVSGGGGAPLYPIRCGVKGKKRCPVDDGMEHVASEHHYVMVTVTKDSARVCPRRPDRSALEPCIRYRLGQRGGRHGRGR